MMTQSYNSKIYLLGRELKTSLKTGEQTPGIGEPFSSLFNHHPCIIWTEYGFYHIFAAEKEK
jgi:hypothetical protein